jgi:SAM-dependent methyltransferase
MPYEYPKNYSRFYDLIYHQQRDGIDNKFFLNEINQTKGKILEIGVGTGRLFCDALLRGADIFGLDISQSMIDVLYKKLDKNQQQRISLQNIIDFTLSIKFDLIIAPFHVMMHLLEKDEQIKALNNVYKHLTPNGRFVFDVFVPDLNQLLNGSDNLIDFENEYNPGKRIKRTVSTKPDLINQLIHITFLLEWDENNEIKHEEWTFPLRYFFRYELEHLVERSQFEKYKIMGDYLGNELNQKSKEFILICQKQ